MATSREPGIPPVVGIGASAGGVESLQRFFRNLPPDLGAVYVVILHLAPDRESELSAILSRETTMPVRQITDAEPAPRQPNCVFVVPPDRRLELTDASVSALPFARASDARVSIDLFFRSLSAAQCEVFAVILSGGGSDGSTGAKAVKEAGGLVLVQDPNDAPHGSMPLNAIASGVADLVAPIEDLVQGLTKFIRGGPRAADDVTNDEQPLVEEVFALLRRRTDHDFSRYKRNTVSRRLVRRMQLSQTGSLAHYIEHLEENPQEVQALFNDLLISVTTFFRDPAAWAALGEEVVAPLLERTDHSAEPIRCWVPGCATGEEAYSLAITFAEEMERLRVKRDMVIFASDLDERALAFAREGVYPRSIAADVSEARLERWFRESDDYYRVESTLRERVVFASHDLNRDPPFSRLHLLSCRNLLIYLNAELQRQVMETFHYACRPDGYLFLGSAETATPDLFQARAKEHRIYQPRPLEGGRHVLPNLAEGVIGVRTASEKVEMRTAVSTKSHTTMLEALAPPSVVVDRQWNLKSLSESAGRYFEPQGGPATLTLTESVRPELRSELTVALRHAFDSGEPWLSDFCAVRFNGVRRRIAVLVQPRKQDPASEALVTFLDAGPMSSAASDADEPDSEKERSLLERLHQAEQQVDQLRREHHSSEEDLRGVNEELQSVNEEYRSTTEELEASKEELQSINEELQTVNQELISKLEEISRAHDDLGNLMAATAIPTLFLDAELNIMRFTPQIQQIFRIKSHDQGRYVGDITHSLRYDALEIDAMRVVDKVAPLEREVESETGQAFKVYMRPYRTIANKIDGVVVTFVDITSLKRAEADLRRSERQFRALVDASADVLYVMNADWTEMRELRGGGFVADIDAPTREWMDEYILAGDQPMIRTAIQAAIAGKRMFDQEHRVRRVDGTIGWTASRAVPILDDQGAIVEWFGAATDVTARKTAESALLEADQHKDEFLAVLSHELRNPLAPLRTGIDVLREAETRPQLIGTVRPMMERQLTHLVRLVDDLLDVSKLSRGQLELQRAPIDLSGPVELAVEQMRPIIEDRRHELVTRFSAEPLAVLGDFQRLAEIATNLLSNAAKYTDMGGRIEISTEATPDEAILRVRDNGYGIPAGRTRELFAIFRQIPEHRHRSGNAGLGIGLALAKQLVELHGGVIEVNSEGENRGSEFVVRVPVHRASDLSTAAPVEPVPLPVRKVLIVEDNVDAATGLLLLLRLMGQKVEVAHDGATALQRVREFKPEVVLLDLGLPDISGLEVAERIRAMPDRESIKIVALTGWGRKEDRVRTQQVGFDDHLTKPIERAALEQTLREPTNR